MIKNWIYWLKKKSAKVWGKLNQPRDPIYDFEWMDNNQKMRRLRRIQEERQNATHWGYRL